MVGITLHGRPLLLAAGTSASVTYRNPKLGEVIQDDYSLPLALPVRGNELALGHVHQLHLRDRHLQLPHAGLQHDGVAMHQGVLQVLGSTATAVRASFSAQGFAALVRGVKLRDALAGRTIDMVATHGGAVQHAKAVTMAQEPHESHCFPLFLAPLLYGSSNPHWAPSISEWSAGSGYSVDALVTFLDTEPILRSWTYQCLEETSAGQSPATHPEKWRRVVFGLANSYNVDAQQYDTNDGSGNFYALVPWFRYDWILRTAMLHLGLHAVGDFFADHLTPHLLLPNANPLDAEQRLGEWAARQSTPVQHEPADYPARLPLDDDTTPPFIDPDDHYDPGALTFQVDTAGTHRFRVYVEATFSSADQLALTVRRASNDSIVVGPGGFPLTLVTPGSAIAHQHLFEFTLVFDVADEGEDFYLCAEAYNAGPFMATVDLANCWAVSWRQSEGGVNDYATLIDPARHVPDMELGEFLQAVADAFGLEVVPELEMGRVRFDIKERLLRPAARRHRTTDISARLAGPMELDHSRAKPGLRWQWPGNDSRTAAPAGSSEMPGAQREVDLDRPGGPSQHCVVQATRKLLRSVFHAASNTYVWEHHGYLVPEVVVGNSAEAEDLRAPLEPLHMEEVGVDGRMLLVPRLEAGGQSPFFATDGDSDGGKLWLCINLGPRPAAEDDGLYPAAGSWGMDAKAQETWTLLPAGTRTTYPNWWDHMHRRWVEALVRSEPITTDLLADHAFVRDHRRRNDVLHINGSDLILEELPLQYGSSRSRLLSTGAYLRRLLPDALGQAQPQVYVPPAQCLGQWPGEVIVVDHSITSNLRKAAEVSSLYTEGQRLLIVDHADGDPPGTDPWEQRTGYIVQYTPGTGEGGGDHTYTPVPPGAMVKAAYGRIYAGKSGLEVAFDERTYIIVQQVASTHYTDNGGSGLFALNYMDVFNDQLLPASAENHHLDPYSPYTGVLGNWLSHADPCRTMIWQSSPDTETWTDVDMAPVSELAAFIAIPFDSLPEGTLYLRARWFRGGETQGYGAVIEIP